MTTPNLTPSELMLQVTGTQPILINVPHAGTQLPPSLKANLRDDALDLKDTDWHMADFALPCAELGASVLAANYSRYVVDLNRSREDTPLYSGPTTGLVSQIDFDGEPLYKEGKAPSQTEVQTRIETYWAPYHAALEAEIQRIKSEFGVCILLDLHSIRSQVPRLFENTLPDLNLGTNSGQSTDLRYEGCAEAQLNSGNYSFVKNGRFKGGYITRHYGRPDQNIHALQLEIAQSTYMIEQTPWTLIQEKADQLTSTIKGLASALLAETSTA